MTAEKPLSQEIHKRTWTPFFEAILKGDKNAEVRLNDFKVQMGDTLILDEWNPDTGYTGRTIKRKVKAVFPVDFRKFHTDEEIEKFGHLYIELENPEVEALESEVSRLTAENEQIKTANEVLKSIHTLKNRELLEAESALGRAREPLKLLMRIINLMSTGSGMGITLFFPGNGETVNIREVQNMLLQVHSDIEKALAVGAEGETQK